MRRLAAILFSLLPVATAFATPVSLHEGTRIAVSASRSGERLSMDLAGRIWLVDPGNGQARGLTPPGGIDRRPALSPDGKRIVYESHTGSRSQLWLVGTEGGEPRQITFGGFDHHSPAWHPDGHQIVMVSNRSGNDDLWILDIDSLELQQLSFSTGDERDPAYSADGSRIAYVIHGTTGDSLYILESGRRPHELIHEAGRISGPAWRPDGSLITYTFQRPGRSELRMVILSSPPVIKPLSRGENVFPFPAAWLDPSAFLYTADGRIKRRELDAFSSTELPFTARIELPDRGRRRHRPVFDDTGPQSPRGITGFAMHDDHLYVTALGDIWELNTSGAVVRQLTHDAAIDTQLALSPDGTRLAFVSDRSGSLQIHLLAIDDPAEQHQLTHVAGAALYPAWRADGETLAYLRIAHPAMLSAALRVIGADGKSDRLVAAGLPTPSPPGWSPDGEILLSIGDDTPAGRRAHRTLLAWKSDGSTGSAPTLPVTAVDSARWSPDGRWLAVRSAGRLSIFERRADGRLVRTTADAPATGDLLRWVADSTALLIESDGELMRVVPETGAVQTVAVRLHWRAKHDARRVVIRAGKVFDGLGPGYRYAQDIVIADGRIQSMQAWSDPPPPGNLIDARGLTVIPGLIDMSVNSRWTEDGRSGRRWLAFGVTSIRESGHVIAEIRERRESRASSRRPGPRVFITATPIDDRRSLQTETDLDALIMPDGLESTRLQAAIEAAHERGLPAIVGKPFPGLLLGADEVPLTGSRQDFNRFVYGDVIELTGSAHLTSVSRLAPAGLPDLIRSDPLAEVPQYLALFRPAEREWYSSSWNRQATVWGRALSVQRRTAGQSLFRAVGRGARIVTGSDAPVSPPGLGLHAELRLLAATGLQPFQVLGMATREAARALGAAQQLGQLKPGMLADLVLVDGDPLQDIRDTVRIVATISRGHVYPADSLMLPDMSENLTPESSPLLSN